MRDLRTMTTVVVIRAHGSVARKAAAPAMGWRGGGRFFIRQWANMDGILLAEPEGRKAVKIT
jgi:hypothetical protein